MKRDVFWGAMASIHKILELLSRRRLGVSLKLKVMVLQIVDEIVVFTSNAVMVEV